MILSPEPFRLDSRHWLLAIVVAMATHTIIFLSYHSDNVPGLEETNQKSIVIRLRKIASLPNVAPVIKEQPRTEPPPEPVVKPKPVIKSKPKKQLDPKPSAIVKPVKILEAKVEPIQYDYTQRETNNVSPEDVLVEEIDVDLKRNYEFQLLAWLQQHKKYPNLARRRGQEGAVILNFVINVEGKLLTHKIVQASVHAELNIAVVNMIKRASPLPPVPLELHRNKTQFSYTIPIHFSLRKQ